MGNVSRPNRLSVFIPDDPVVEASVLITFLPAEVKKFSLDALENIYELNVEVW